MTPTDKLELQVAEESDGSAVVQLPHNEDNPQESAEERDSDALDDDDGPGDDSGEGATTDDPERASKRWD
jgi:hypothetical protein